MEKVSIIGSGNVGANTAFFIAEKGVTNVFLYDIQDGLSTGKALDMMEAAPIRKYRNSITGIDDIGETAGSETVVIAAGTGCALGTDRADLLRDNWGTVRDIAEKVTGVSPEAVIVVATEPVDLLVGMLAKTFKLPRRRLLGIGGILDGARLRSALSRELSVSADDITAMVIGRHSEDMIVLWQYARVSGIPIEQLLGAEKIEVLENEVREAGALMAQLAECPGTYYTPSAAAAEIIDSIHMDLKRILPVSVELQGEYGISGVAMSVPCVIGKSGVEKVLTPMLIADQLMALKKSAKDIEGIIAGIKS